MSKANDAFLRTGAKGADTGATKVSSPVPAGNGAWTGICAGESAGERTISAGRMETNASPLVICATLVETGIVVPVMWLV